jgi:hypothetical protein
VRVDDEQCLSIITLGFFVDLQNPLLVSCSNRVKATVEQETTAKTQRITAFI